MKLIFVDIAYRWRLFMLCLQPKGRSTIPHWGVSEGCVNMLKQSSEQAPGSGF